MYHFSLLLPGKLTAVAMQDPLLSLPPEVLLQVCSLLPAADLARLTELSRGWRRFIADADESLWRDAEVNMSRLSFDVKPTPGALRALIRAPCLGVLRLPVEPSWANWGRKQQCRLHPKLEWALGRVRKVSVGNDFATGIKIFQRNVIWKSFR